MEKTFKRILTIALVLAVAAVGSAVLPGQVLAADGSGTASISPSSATINTYNTFTVTYTAAETMSGGKITVAMPTNWSAPQGSAGTYGYVTAASTGTLGKVLNSMDAGTFTGSTVNITGTVQATTKTEGTNALDIAVAAAAAGGETVRAADIAAADWSSYTNVAFWIRSTAITTLGQFQFTFSETAALGGVPVVIDIPAITAANTWQYVNLAFAGAGTTRDAVLSYGIKYTADVFGVGTGNIYVDDILLGPDAVNSLSFASQTATAKILTIANTQTITLTYGSGGGASAARTSGTVGSAAFTTSSAVLSGGTLTAISSSPTVTLAAVGARTVSPPTAAITNPVGGSTVTTSVYTIIGTAIPASNSSIQYIKLTIDGNTYDVTSSLAGNNWSYDWRSIGEGTHTLSTTVADWANNVATGASITLTVKYATTTNVSVSKSTVTVSPASLVADGASTSTIKVTIKDDSEAVLADKVVTVSGSRGINDVIPTVTKKTGADGVATFEIKSSTAGVSTITVMVGDLQLTAMPTITFTVPGAIAGPATPATPSGVTLYRVTGDPRVYVIKDGKKQWIKTPAEFNAGGYKWTDISEVSANTLAAYPEIEAAVVVSVSVKINTASLRVRASNTAASGILGRVRANEIYTVLEEKAGWYKIKTKTGVTGWISGAYATKQ